MTSASDAARPDEESRKQIRELVGTNLYVEAGAGTGKTRALIDRLAELLVTHGVDPENVAAITFTRAAAFEMRWRLREELERRQSDPVHAESGQRIQEVLDTLDGLSIQTIHAFALSMLREHPLEIGLTPVIEPLDDVQRSVEFEALWTEWISERLEDDPELAASLGNAQRLGLTTPVETLRKLAEELSEHHHEIDAADYPPEPIPDGVPVESFASVLDIGRRYIEAANIPQDGMSVFFRDAVEPQLESVLLLSGGAETIPATDLVDWAELKPGGKGNAKNWQDTAPGVDGLNELRDLISDLQGRVDEVRSALARRTLAIFLKHAIDFAKSYAAERHSRGRLTFHDQLVLAIRLLSESGRARRQITARFQHILVDEFQDTDPEQIKLLRLLAETAGELRPGSLFLVGDPKQSIYRFRGADPASSGAFSAKVANTGHKPYLSENHRSLPGILNWVNRIFSEWMKGGEESGQAEYRPLETGYSLDDAQIGAPVRWFGGDRDGNAELVRAHEYEHVAAIANAAGNGEFRVRDLSSKEWRDSRYSDVAILVRSRSHLDSLEDRLTEQNVPYTLDNRGPLFKSQDVRDLHSCLAAIDDPSNEVSVLAALRSPAFSCPDTDLLRWKNAGGGFSYLSDDAPATPSSVAAAFGTLQHFHSMSRERSTAELVEQFIRSTRLREKADLSRTGPERSRRLDLVVELARSLSDPDSGGAISLRDFTRWLVHQSEENAQMPERLSQGDVDNAVRVMTIHTSKGLEFPIVIMTSVSGRSGGGGSSQIKVLRNRDDESQRAIEVQLGAKSRGMSTDGYESATERDRQDESLEEVRLLYVAATRARDHLFVSRVRGTTDKKASPVMFEQYLEGAEDLWTEWRLPGRERPRPQASATGIGTVADREAWRVRREQVVAEAARPRYTTPTGLKQTTPDAEDEPQDKEPARPLDDEPQPRGRAATSIGRAVHAVLQDVSLASWTDEEVAALAERAAAEHGVPGETAEIARLAIASLNTPIMQRASAAARNGQAWKEVSVAAPLRGIEGELEGQIDLLFRERDGSLTLVDHKTDRYGGRDIGESAAPYELQMGAYAWCVEAVTGQKVDRAVLVFSRRAADGIEAEFEVPRLPDIAQRAADLAEDRIASPAPAN